MRSFTLYVPHLLASQAHSPAEVLKPGIRRSNARVVAVVWRKTPADEYGKRDFDEKNEEAEVKVEEA